MSDCDVLFISDGDWANMGSHLAESLRQAGVKAKSWAAWHLKMKYPIKSSIYKSRAETFEDAKGAKVIWLMHGRVFHPPINDNQLLCAFHGGPPLLKVNGVRSEVSGPAFFCRYVNRGLPEPVHFIQHPRLFDNCNHVKHKYLLSPPVDTERLQPIYYNGKERLIVGHFPRNTGNGLKTKGHKKVMKVLRSLKEKIAHNSNTEFVDWKEHIKRVAKCDIYVEKISTIIREWGMTALEAAALGKIVIGQFDNRETYEKYYGPSPIITANTPQELFKVVDTISGWSKEQVVMKQQATRKWVEKFHSMKAVGMRLNAILKTELELERIRNGVK